MICNISCIIVHTRYLIPLCIIYTLHCISYTLIHILHRYTTHIYKYYIYTASIILPLYLYTYRLYIYLWCYYQHWRRPKNWTRRFFRHRFYRYWLSCGVWAIGRWVFVCYVYLCVFYECITVYHYMCMYTNTPAMYMWSSYTCLWKCLLNRFLGIWCFYCSISIPYVMQYTLYYM